MGKSRSGSSIDYYQLKTVKYLVLKELKGGEELLVRQPLRRRERWSAKWFRDGVKNEAVITLESLFIGVCLEAGFTNEATFDPSNIF